MRLDCLHSLYSDLFLFPEMKDILLAVMHIICITWHCAIIIILGECGLGLLQLVTMQKEIQKQMTVMVAVPVAKEGKRMEGILLF